MKKEEGCSRGPALHLDPRRSFPWDVARSRLEAPPVPLSLSPDPPSLFPCPLAPVPGPPTLAPRAMTTRQVSLCGKRINPKDTTNGFGFVPQEDALIGECCLPPPSLYPPCAVLSSG